MKGTHLSFWQNAYRVCQLQHNKGSSRAEPEHVSRPPTDYVM